MPPICLKHMDIPVLLAFIISAVNPCICPALWITSLFLMLPFTLHCQILKEVLSNAAKAEPAALFHDEKEAYPNRNILAELARHDAQPSTPIITDSGTASGIANDTVRQKRFKAMDMRFYWFRDGVDRANSLFTGNRVV